jgi:hypothetical protein
MLSESGHIERIEQGVEAYASAETQACNACGASPRRREARFCATCGQRLGVEYFPTDALRASYRFGYAPAQRKTFAAAAAPKPWRERGRPRTASARLRGREVMPSRSEDGSAATALAFVTYGLVPYLGILFCPGALLFGGLGLLRTWRAPHASARHARTFALSIALGLLVLCAQVLLWWILYKVPEWSSQVNF